MRKKIIKVAVLVMVLVMAYNTVVSALSANLSMQADNTTVPESTEFLVKVKVSNIDAGENGINSVSAFLELDKSVFEDISESSIEGINGWSSNYDSGTGKVTLVNQSFVKEEKEIFTMTFKTKEKVSGKEGTIKLKDIKVGNSDTNIDVDEVSLNIRVGNPDEANIANATNTNSVTINVTTNSNSNTNTKANVTNNTTNNTANKAGSYINATNVLNDKIPETGVKDNITILIAGVIILAIIVYIRIEMINKDMKK